MRGDLTRRSFLRFAGTGLVASMVSGVATTQSSGEWTTASSPVDDRLNDVVQTSAGPYAVGDNGIVLKRTSDGWQTVLQDGPGGDSNNLFGAGVTDDGDRLWYVGASGAIGEFDVQSGSQVTDHSSPNDVTNNFNAVAATGPAGDANVYIGGDSGKIYYTFDNGNFWSQTTPGSGAEINAVDFHGPKSGHAIDGNQKVLETTDGATYQKIGIEDADANFFGLDSNSADDVWVVTGDGRVYHNDGSEWTSEFISDTSLYDIDIEGGSGVAVGDDGNVFDLVDGSWSQTTTSNSQTLAANALGAPNVAVGADGTILERPQEDDDGDGGSRDDGSGDGGSGDGGSGDDGSGDGGSGDGGSGDDGSGDDGSGDDSSGDDGSGDSGSGDDGSGDSGSGDSGSGDDSSGDGGSGDSGSGDDSSGDGSGDGGSGDSGSGDDSSGDGSGDGGSGDGGSGDGGSGDDGSGDDGSGDGGSNGGNSELLSPGFGRFDTDDSGHITFDEVINAIDAHNSDRPVGGEPVTSQDVLSLIAFYSRN